LIRNIAAFSLLALAVGCGPSQPPTPPGASIAPASAQQAGTLEWAVAGDWRLPVETARDAARHPRETLAFFGVRPTDTVVELWPGGGYYTAILAPYLRAGGGHFIAAQMDPASSPDTARAVQQWRDAFVSKLDVFGQIEVTTASRNGTPIAPDGTADVVLTFRNIHNWMAGGYADRIFADAFRALKPGGTLGVEEHRLPSNKDQDPSAGTGYVKEAYVIQLAEAAGFELVERSEINANPRDTADHPLGVWMLPPVLRSPAPGTPAAASYDPAAYRAIGESDRMTLKFRKPAEAPATPAPSATPTP
jgi:predicted methyltransferase